eukprot:IDg3477t1
MPVSCRKSFGRAWKTLWRTTAIYCMGRWAIGTCGRKHPYMRMLYTARCKPLDSCVGFIDGTVIEVSRPYDDALQNLSTMDIKRKHAVKYQAITIPDGMFLHV